MEAYRLKIKSLEETLEECTWLRASDKKIVFTNGCFDILHPGHTRYLFAARELGDHLVVAVNSDRSVRALKGPGRPIFNEQQRAELVSALGCVDTVLIFDEDNPLRVIEQLLPDILVKGGDWTEKTIIGAEVVKRSGGSVKAIPYIEGFSTTKIIEKIKRS
jgi:D-beta-D-heptose 7-phosphate kinase/D-beta-D-heptose 1-phosphate adenosyltransferase